MSSKEERLFAGIEEDGVIRGDLSVRSELMQYHKGFQNELGSRAMRLLDVITARDVAALYIHSEIPVVHGTVHFEDEQNRIAA